MYLPTKHINMVDIRTINSEVEVRKDIIKKFKQERIVDQTAFYLDKGADHYYNPNKKFSGEQYDYPKLARLIGKIISKKKGKRAAIVSLACGSCKKDKLLLEHLQELGHNISFFGVDSSMAMIKKANKVLSNVTFEANLICADFGAFNFKTELNNIVGDYDLKIYLFFGHTLGNLNQSYMADILKNILHKGDYLLLDVIGFETITVQIQAKLFERYSSYLESPPEMEFFLSPLKTLGIPEDCGELTLEVTTDNATKARLFKFGFKINTLVTFNLEGGEVNSSPDEHISLYHVLVYDLNKLTEFLSIRDFKLKEQVTGKFVNQLLFERH